MKKLFLLFSLSSVILISSCQKDTTPVCTLSTSSIAGTYKTTASTIQANATATPVDDYGTWAACEKDDLFTLNADGTFSTSEGATSCTPPSSNVTGNWSLSGSNITITVFGFSQSGTVTDFSCNSFKLKTVDSTTGEITITTLTKQ